MQNNSNSTDYQEFREPGGGPNSGNSTETLNYRNWTYTLPDVDGQVLTTESGERSFNVTMSLNGGAIPSMYVLPLNWTSMTAFNFTNGASIPTVTLNALMRVSPQPYNTGAISSADICALSFCAHRCNVSVFLNHLSSTILQTVQGIRVWGRADGLGTTSWLSFTGDDINMTYPSNIPGIIFENDNWVFWQSHLRELVDTFTGNVTVRLN